MSITVLNTDAGLSGKTLDTLETDQTITGAKTFDRDPNPPFVVTASSAVVPNLDADKLDGQHAPTGTIVGTSDSQTLTNKTLTSPTINSGTIAGTFAGVFSLSAQYRAIVTHSTTQSLNSATYTVVSFNTETLDITGMHDTVTNNSRITIPSDGAGVYLVIGNIQVAVNTNGDRGLRLLKNGSEVPGTRVQSRAATGVNHVMQTVSIQPLAAADYLELSAYQDSGGSLNINDSLAPAFSVIKLA